MVKKRIAVIGAGPSGLVAARHLTARSQDFECHVFERSKNIGGTWQLSDHVGTDSYGLPVHSSMYKNLRTNLPMNLMCYPDFPLSMPVTEQFVDREVVLQYLEKYADTYNLRQQIKFNHFVKNVRLTGEENWEINVVDLASGVQHQHLFDAVMVCNGHFSEPLMPKIPGADLFCGTIIHSHDYREPTKFSGQRVLVVGAGPSAMDIAMEVSECAQQVVISHHLKNEMDLTNFQSNVGQCADVECFTKNGANFKDNSQCDFDSIIFCTGYVLDFPFLDATCGVTVTEHGVEPLYRHLIHINHPTMCFLSLPNHVVPFPLADLQTRYFLSFLDGRFNVPSKDEMRAVTNLELKKRKDDGLTGMRLAHFMGDNQREYYDLLAEEADIEPIFSSIPAENLRCLVHNNFSRKGHHTCRQAV